MKTDAFLKTIVDPTLQMLAGAVGIPVSDKARVLLMTIAGQESDWMARRQNGGPARSYWQFEGAGGGVGELFAVTPTQLKAVCASLDIPYNIVTVFEAMAWNDTLACSMARLLLWQDPMALPDVGDKATSWNYYARNWRPGAPHPEVWPQRYDAAIAAMKGSP